MNRDSKLFDSIRIKKGSKAKAAKPVDTSCQWENCNKPGTHKAPLGRNPCHYYKALDAVPSLFVNALFLLFPETATAEDKKHDS